MLGIVLVAAAVVGPGYLLSRVLAPASAPSDRATLAVGLGLATTSWLALTLGYLFQVQVTSLMVLGLGLLTAIGSGAWLWHRRHQGPPAGRATRGSWALLGLCVLIALAYALNYDPYLFRHGSCLSEDVFYLGASWPALLPQPVDLRGLTGGQRLGAIAWPLPTWVLAGSGGFRLLFGLNAFLIAGSCAALGRSVLGSNRAGAATALIATLSPYLFQVAVVDENIITCALLALTLSVCVLPETIPARPFIAGGLFALTIAVRHLTILALPGVAIVLLHTLRDAERRRGLLQFLAAASVVALPMLYHHVTWFAPGAWESRYASPGGITGLPSYAYFNWPIHDVLVRTPFNPFPTAIMFPLRYLQETGILLSSCTLIGAWALYGRDRHRSLGFAAIVIPVALALAPLEQWTKPNKMGVLLCVWPPLALATMAGLRWLLAPPQTRRALVLGAVGTTLALAVLAASLVDVPADARTYRRSAEQRRFFQSEDPSALAALRAEALDIGVFPRLASYGRFSWPFALRKLRSGADARFPLRLGPTQPRQGGSARLWLGANKYRERWYSEESEGAEASVTISEGAPLRVGRPLEVPWTPDQLHVLMLRRGSILFVLTVFDNLREPGLFDPANELQILYPGHRSPTSATEMATVSAPDGVLRVALGGLSHLVSIDVVSNSDELFIIRELHLAESGPEIGAPRWLYLP